MRIAIMILMGLILIPSVSGAAVVSVENVSTDPGTTFTVPIKVIGIENLSALDIRISYDKNTVVVENISKGDIGDLAASAIDNPNGTARMSWLSATGKKGDVVFAYVAFKAVGSAGQKTTPDIIIKEMVDVDGKQIEHTVQKGTFAIIGAATSPTPVKTNERPQDKSTPKTTAAPQGATITPTNEIPDTSSVIVPVTPTKKNPGSSVENGSSAENTSPSIPRTPGFSGLLFMAVISLLSLWGKINR